MATDNIRSGRPLLPSSYPASRPPPVVGPEPVPPPRGDGPAAPRATGPVVPRDRDAPAPARRGEAAGRLEDGVGTARSTQEAGSSHVLALAADADAQATSLLRRTLATRQGARNFGQDPRPFAPDPTAPAGNVGDAARPDALPDAASGTAPGDELARLRTMHREHRLSLQQEMKAAAEAHNRPWLQVLCEMHVQIDEHYLNLEQDFLARNSPPEEPDDEYFPRAGNYRAEEKQELLHVLADLRARRASTRLRLAAAIREAFERGDNATLTLLAEWHRGAEDGIYQLMAAPVTQRQQADQKLLAGLDAQHSRARSKLHQAMRQACESNCAGVYGMLLELQQEMEERFHARRLRLEV
jgi:hypothetical protein